MSSDNNPQNKGIYMLSGAAAGVIADGAMHPVDTIRARLQVQRGSSDPNRYKGLVDCFSRVIRNEGWRPLYRGFGIVVCSTALAHALYFSGYELAKKYLMPNTPEAEKSALVHLASGMVAEIAGAMLWVPMDVIKQRQQIQRSDVAALNTHRYQSGNLEAIRTIFKEEGIRGFYRGYLASIVAFGPFCSLYFATYEQTKRSLAKMSGAASVHDLPTYMLLGSGAFASGIAAAVTTPLDVIKTRLMVQGSSEQHNFGYKNIRDAIVSIWKQEGPSAFAKGMSARVVWIAPGSAITMAAYEEFKRFFKMLKEL